MITRATFKKIMGQLEANVEWCARLSEVCGDADVIYEHASIDEVVYAIAAAFGDGSEYDEFQSLLFRWIFMADFGKAWDDEDTHTWGTDMSTLDGLYDYLLGGINPKEKADYEEYQTVFAVSSGLEDCPDFELTYHPNGKYYSMSMETIYGMDAVQAHAYVQSILDEFTEWMHKKCLDTTCTVDLHEVFANGVALDRRYRSIEDAYANFAVLAHGALVQGIEGWDYGLEITDE